MTDAELMDAEADLLRAATGELKDGTASVALCGVSFEICHRWRGDPLMAEVVGEFIRAADEITGGICSAQLESWASTRQ